jgi:Uma2 family endonuclease
MSLTMTPPSTTEGPRLRRWTVAEYQRAAQMGLFGPEERLELIDGEIYEKMPPDPPHSTGIDLARFHITRAFQGVDCYLRSENPVVLPNDGQPEPDIAVVAGVPGRYRDHHPGPEDVLLIVEVADSSLSFDRRQKGPQYAVAGIQEYWILNLPDRCLEVFRLPQNGGWTATSTVAEDGAVSPLAAPGATVRVADLLP